MNFDYENRLTCFIDILGFQDHIKKTTRSDSKNNTEINSETIDDDSFIFRHQLCTLFSNQLHPNKLKKYGHGLIPKDTNNNTLNLEEDYPIYITQFSDSYVISCPAGNHVSSLVFLAIVYTLVLEFFNEGLLTRGGLTLGEIIHENGGMVFGPAMNESYNLENKTAIYPRIVFSKKAEEHIYKTITDERYLLPIKKSFDGHTYFDVISILSWTIPENNPSSVGAQVSADAHKETLDSIAQSVNNATPNIRAKIEYLLHQWKELLPTY